MGNSFLGLFLSVFIEWSFFININYLNEKNKMYISYEQKVKIYVSDEINSENTSQNKKKF